MNQAQLEALLGRSLTPREATNRRLYLDIAREEIESLMCISLCCNDSEARTFEPREGMSTVFTGIFTDIEEVRVDGTVVTDYYKAFWDNRNGSFYNSIVFATPQSSEVEIEASWGFDNIPSDLKRLWTQMFAVVSKKRTVSHVKSKKVEDFSVTYTDESDIEAFARDNAVTIRKYSMCTIGDVRHGGIC